MGTRRDDPAHEGTDHCFVETTITSKTVLWSLSTGAPGEGVQRQPESVVDVRTLSIADAMQQAAEVLRGGELVAFPTETVYGLGGLALDLHAVSRIFAAKHRPADNPLIAHVSSMRQVAYLCDTIPATAMKLMEAFWPGPLSILLPARADLPAVLTAGLPMVAVRMPRHPLALALIDAVGQPLAAPSANLSGRPSPTSAEHVLQDFAGHIGGVIDGGPCEVGIESTVVAVEEDGQLVILRPGHITREDLAAFAEKVVFDPHLQGLTATDQPRAPGQKYRHYAPRGDVQLVAGRDRTRLHAYLADQAAAMRQEGLRVAILPLLPAPTLTAADADLLFPLGSFLRPSEVAHNLYAALRACDDQDCARIFIECPPDGERYEALRNRMMKAANSTCLTLP
ncbi:MAG: L-threonylcarbamoyladenylate synthase [Firmicutes bacterium]|nr:L-threonylcarbamoyladenylate synthase [Bacillota bacterium]